MTWPIELLVALGIALLIAFPLVLALGWRAFSGPHGTATSLLFAVLTLFLAALAGGLWIEPFGPAAFGVALIPFAIIAIGVAVALSAAAPRRKPDDPGALEATTGALGASCALFALLFALFAAVVAAYGLR